MCIFVATFDIELITQKYMYKLFFFFTFLLASQIVSAQQQTEQYYLLRHRSAFADGVAYATSPDGVHFHDLACGYPAELPVSIANIAQGLAVDTLIQSVYDISPKTLATAAVKGSFKQLTTEEYELLQTWSDTVEPYYLASDQNNPVFRGKHADPEVLYSHQTGKYYIYPTTDGTFGWHSHDFHCFSSPDLKTWTDEGVIFDLQDLSWGKEYAWAPCIIERPTVEQGDTIGYKYYFYFVANKSIGVAVADRPEGPFVDALGHAMFNQELLNAPNITIDPDVFCDPATGKYYLYFGNSFLWMAELAEDMTSLVPGTMHELIPRSKIGDYHYLEGTYVFERNGLYYFMWSENITRSAHYRIRYLISDSPTEFVRNGKKAEPEDEIILQLNPEKQIFGTGHNSAICLPGTDEWYMVYHRFVRPGSIKLGLSGGYHREVCIDSMYFRPDGTIVPVVPTL